MIKARKRSKRNLLIGFGFSLLILLLSSGVSYFSIKQLLDSQQWVEHTAQVNAELDNLMSRMKDAETGQRGYLLTGDDVFLEPYTGAKNDVTVFFDKVRSLTRDNPSQQRDFPLLDKLIEEKFELIAKTINDKKKGIPPTEITLLKGKAIMDSIRTVTKVMVKRESDLMVIRNAKLDKFAASTPILIVLVALIAMIVTIVFYIKVKNDGEASVALREKLLKKEKDTSKQIEVIDGVAKKIADGDYSARVKDTDLRT